MINHVLNFSTLNPANINPEIYQNAINFIDLKSRRYHSISMYGHPWSVRHHTLNAIGNMALEYYGVDLVNYFDLNNSIDRHMMHCFAERLPNAEVIMFDGIDLLDQFPGIEWDFFEIYNYIHETKKFIAISCEVHPNRLSIHDRIKTRFEWGILEPITNGQPELRV